MVERMEVDNGCEIEGRSADDYGGKDLHRPNIGMKINCTNSSDAEEEVLPSSTMTISGYSPVTLQAPPFDAIPRHSSGSRAVRRLSLAKVAGSVEPPPCQPDIPESSSNVAAMAIPASSQLSVASTASSRGDSIRRRADKLRRQLSLDSSLSEQKQIQAGQQPPPPRRGKKKARSRFYAQAKNQQQRQPANNEFGTDQTPELPSIPTTSMSRSVGTTGDKIAAMTVAGEHGSNAGMDASCGSHQSFGSRSSVNVLTPTSTELTPKRNNSTWQRPQRRKSAPLPLLGCCLHEDDRPQLPLV